MRSTIIALLATLLATTQAHAWGDREQGVLTGIAGLLMLQHATKDRSDPQYIEQHHHHYEERRYWTPHRPNYPLPAYQDMCRYRGQQAFIYNQYGEVIGWRYC